MKTNAKTGTVALLVAGVMLTARAQAATISEQTAAPTGNILASQLTDLGPGTVDTTRDYADNGGPPGQTFTVTSSALLGSVTVLGRGDSAGSYSGGYLPFTGSEIWGIQIASVNTDGSLNVLDSETATGFGAGEVNISDYLTFTLANPVSLSPGVTYAWSIDFSGQQTAWFGFAHSTGDAYADGYAFNNNSSIDNPGGNTGGSRYAFNGFAAPNPNGYDYVFAAQAVPEPGTMALLSLGGLVMAMFRRRRV